jgi:transposase
MIAANRWAWNLLIEKVGDRMFKTMNGKELELLQNEVRQYIKKENIDPSLIIQKCNEQCFDSAFRDLFKARETAIANQKEFKNRTGVHYELTKLKFKSIKDNSNSIELRGREFTYFPKLGKLKFHPKIFGYCNGALDGIKIKTELIDENDSTKNQVQFENKIYSTTTSGKSEVYYQGFEYSVRLQKTGDKYYIIIPRNKELPKVDTTICSIDPGVRSFITGYDPNGRVFEFGSNQDFISRKQRAIRQLNRKIKKCSSKRQRGRLKKQVRYTYNKIKNCISDLHHTAVKYLATNYSQVILPNFRVKEMTARKVGGVPRKLSKSSVNAMINWSHYKFRELLKNKMKQHQGSVISCTEEYTSMTCGQCGRLNHKLGSDKLFTCPYKSCGYVQDRDVNAAYNIYHKNIRACLT